LTGKQVESEREVKQVESEREVFCQLKNVSKA